MQESPKAKYLNCTWLANMNPKIIYAGLLRRVHREKNNFNISTRTYGVGTKKTCLKDSSFEYPKHMLKLVNVYAQILLLHILCIWTDSKT